MITKILITLLIIAIAYWYVTKDRDMLAKTQKESSLSKTVKNYLTTGFLIIILALMLGFGVWHWLDQQQLMQITITSPLDGQSQTYIAKKKAIHSNQITTIEGIKVRFSEQERVTIAPK